MKERPILFSGAMVRAILDERKTQTRRILRSQPEHGVACYTAEGTPGEIDWVLLDEDGDPSDSTLRCPYGVPSDRLWVRETWTPADGRHSSVPILYRADGDSQPVLDDRWRPSIHMPRWASRITLEVTEVRVERLQAITEDDATAEGVEALDGLLDVVALCRRAKELGDPAESSRVWFAELWDSINGKRAPWASNPWVWCVAFRRVS